MTVDPGAALVRALEQSAAAQGCAVTVTDQGWRRWASATFAGARHRLGLRATPSPALDAWLARLSESELAMPGHLVADLGIAAVSRDASSVTAAIEALTVESD